MARRKIKMKLNVDKIVKAWLFKGEKGTYLDITFVFNEDEKPDQYKQIGFVSQDVPSAVYKADKTTKSVILGNGIDWEAAANAVEPEAMAGQESGAMGVDEESDDLPF